jgi:hypothetical protein
MTIEKHPSAASAVRTRAGDDRAVLHAFDVSLPGNAIVADRTFIDTLESHAINRARP